MSRRTTSLARWGSILIVVATVVFGELGCHEAPSDPTNTPPPAPPLEMVPFSALGPGKVAFERVSSDTATGRTLFSAEYLVDGTTRASRAVMNDVPTGVPFNLAISPDGRQMAFDAFNFATTFWEVSAANIDDSGGHAIFSFAASDVGPPTWTPDGSMVVFAGRGDSASWNVYAQPPTAAANATPRELASIAPDTGRTVKCPIGMDRLGDEVPVSVSSNGSLAFSCYESEVDVLSPAGAVTARYILPPTASERDFDTEDPVWSPDGSRVAFLRAQHDSAALGFLLDSVDVMVMDADGGGVTTIASVPAPGVLEGGIALGNTLSLCWTPDGNHFVFNVPEATYVSHLWVVKSDGTGLTQLTSAPGAYDMGVSCAR